MKQLLYCVGPSNEYQYKELLFQPSTMDLYDMHQDIIDTVNKFNLTIDIKVNPCDKEHEYNYWRDVKDWKKFKGDVIKDIRAENIIPNYRIIIFDYIGSMLTSHLMAYSHQNETPVILYMKDLSVLRERCLPDLRRIFSLVSNKQELEDTLYQLIHIFL